jgi:hypothetical protein
MFLEKTYAVLGTGLVWCALFALTPEAQAQKVGELSDNSASILALCNCTSSPEAASTQNCKALLASQNPEQKQTPGANPGANAVHAMMTPQGR